MHYVIGNTIAFLLGPADELSSAAQRERNGKAQCENR
jgi:hypothetical protein